MTNPKDRAELDVDRLTRALPRASVGPYREEDMPSPDEWYREYAESIAREYAREPQVEERP